MRLVLEARDREKDLDRFEEASAAGQLEQFGAVASRESNHDDGVLWAKCDLPEKASLSGQNRPLMNTAVKWSQPRPMGGHTIHDGGQVLETLSPLNR